MLDLSQKISLNNQALSTLLRSQSFHCLHGTFSVQPLVFISILLQATLFFYWSLCSSLSSLFLHLPLQFILWRQSDLFRNVNQIILLFSKIVLCSPSKIQHLYQGLFNPTYLPPLLAFSPQLLTHFSLLIVG